MPYCKPNHKPLPKSVVNGGYKPSLNGRFMAARLSHTVMAIVRFNRIVYIPLARCTEDSPQKSLGELSADPGRRKGERARE